MAAEPARPGAEARHDEESPAGTDFWAGFWRLADPKISLTSAACLYVGVSVAVAEEPVAWDWFAVTALVFFCMEVSKNAWGDVFDWDSGTDRFVTSEDRTEFSGGKRVLVDGLLNRRQTWGIAAGMAALGVAGGLAIVLFREFDALWFGVAGAVIGWSYHGPPFQLVYRGWGEIDVVLVYGPVMALMTYVIQTGAWSWRVFWLSLPLGLVIAAFLWVNEFPDHDADRRAGKRNLVVRLGKRTASQVLPFIYGAAALLLALQPLFGLPRAVWLGALFLVPAAYACVAVLREPETFHRRAPAQPAALVAFLLYAAGTGTGMLIG